MSFWGSVRSTVAQMDSISYYELLGVPRTANSDEVLERFYSLTRKLHPDKHALHPDQDDRGQLCQLYARVVEAKEVLTNYDRRSLYDVGLKNGTTRLAKDARAPTAPTGLDPKTPMARSLYEEGLALARSQNPTGARAKLALARQYEPDSEAIQKALDDLEPNKRANPQEREMTPPPLSPAKASHPPKNVRQHPRSDAAVPVCLRVANWEGLRVFYTRNLSQGGMFLRTNIALDVGATIDLNIVAPDGTDIPITAEVVRVQSQSAGGRQGVAVRFVNTSQALKAQLEQLLEQVSAPPAPVPISLDALVEELARIQGLSPHATLNLPEDARAEAIQNAYRTLVRRYQLPAHETDTTLLAVSRELLSRARNAYEEAIASAQ